MPSFIRQALAERLLKSPRAEAFIRDFSATSGLPLRFATPLGVELEVKETVPEPLPCRWMKSDPRRGQLCARTAQEGMLRASAAGSCAWQCAVSLREAAIALRMGGEVFGYLMVGQVATKPFDRTAINRWRHALERVGQTVGAEELEAMASTVPQVSEERFQAAVRLLEWSVAPFVGQLESQLEAPVEQLSPPIRKACAYIRAHYEQPLSLGEVAQKVGMSREHFCTLFHRGTGLRFVEYCTRVRIDHAKKQLRGTQQSVLEVSLSCGFPTVSHFNRCFRTLVGQSPTAYRKEGQAH